jgi:hypothetical protein
MYIAFGCGMTECESRLNVDETKGCCGVGRLLMNWVRGDPPGSQHQLAQAA